jgi:glycosyltransferase involved in cell wall biosynthesis
MRALIVTNMYPSPSSPARGGFVRDQVEALQALGHDVDVYAFEPGGARRYLRAARALARRREVNEPPDVVHAHFGLSAWPALAQRGAPHVVTLHGTDLAHPRSGPISRAALPFLTLAATVSASLASRVPGAGRTRRVAVLPCGIDLDRFRPLERARARRALSLDPDEPCLLFPADPGRAVKRFDRAREAAGDTKLLTLGAVHPRDVPLMVNAANAVLVTSDSEGFGLAALEALACNVPVLSTPVGIAPVALAGIAGALCAAWEPDAWRSVLQPLLAEPDPRVDGRARAELFSAQRMAERVAVAWGEVAPGVTGDG